MLPITRSKFGQLTQGQIFRKDRLPKIPTKMYHHILPKISTFAVSFVWVKHRKASFSVKYGSKFLLDLSVV